MNRRLFLPHLALGCAAWALAPRLLQAAQHLPLERTFMGRDKFDRIVALALSENWAALPIGERTLRAGQAMLGTPYVGYTLEIDDHIESPSASFAGQDCWTFFEIALGLARMLQVAPARPRAGYQPGDLLHQIETTRYRHGVCNGGYLDRIHYLDEWFQDNQKRGNVKNVTASLGSLIPITDRRIDEMTVLWKSYRYLRENPSLRPGMVQIETELQKRPFRYLPKDRVRAIESRLQAGDIIGIVTHKAHVYCSHVGLAVPQKDGSCRFMHASVTHKKVTLDQPLHAYLASFRSHAGIVVARPLE